MQILQLNRKIAVFGGICSISGESNGPSKTVQSAIVVFVSINLVVLELSSIYFAALQLALGDVVEFLFGFLVTIPLIITLGSYATMTYQREKVGIIFNTLQKFFDRCNCKMDNRHNLNDLLMRINCSFRRRGLAIRHYLLPS